MESHTQARLTRRRDRSIRACPCKLCRGGAISVFIIPLTSHVVNVTYQTEPISVVKALYDYEATAAGELSITEGESLSVYEKDDDWLLVKCERDGGKVGYVPGNYVEEVGFK